jgi:hypothetical protein
LFQVLPPDLVFEIAKNTSDAEDYLAFISCCKSFYLTSKDYSFRPESKGLIFNNYKLSRFQRDVLDGIEPNVIYKIPSIVDRMIVSLVHCSRLESSCLVVPDRYKKHCQKWEKQLGLKVPVELRRSDKLDGYENLIFCEVSIGTDTFERALCKVTSQNVFLFSRTGHVPGEIRGVVEKPVVSADVKFLLFKFRTFDCVPSSKYDVEYRPVILGGEGYYGTHDTLQELTIKVGDCSLVCFDKKTLDSASVHPGVTKLLVSNKTFEVPKGLLVIYIGETKPSESRFRNYVARISHQRNLVVWLVSRSYYVFSLVPNQDLVDDFVEFTGSGKTVKEKFDPKDFQRELTPQEMVVLTRSCRSKKLALEWLKS